MAEHLCPADKNQEAAHWEVALLVLPYPRRFQRTAGWGGGIGRKGDHLARSCNPKKGDRGKTEEPLTRLLHSINHNALCFFRTLLLILTMKLADGHRCPHVAKHTIVLFLTEEPAWKPPQKSAIGPVPFGWLQNKGRKGQCHSWTSYSAARTPVAPGPSLCRCFSWEEVSGCHRFPCKIQIKRKVKHGLQLPPLPAG